MKRRRLTESQRRLVADNAGLVHAVLRRLRIGGNGREDAQAEGMLALCEAARTYVPGRAAFSTWATLRVGWWLRSWMTRTNESAAAAAQLAEHPERWQESNIAPSPEQAADAVQFQSLLTKVLLRRASSEARRVAILAYRGATSDEIARRLGVSVKTVGRHRQEARVALQDLRAIMQTDGSAE